MEPFYEEDLAWVHHAGFSDFAEGAGDELLRIFHDAGLHDGLVIDLGCGTGLWARKLLEHGYSVLGIDVSAAMIEIAQRTAPRAEYRVASLDDADLSPCSAVTALGDVLNYRVGGEAGDPPLGRLFPRVAAHLKAGGIFAFDVLVRFEGDPMRYRTWRTGSDWAVLVDVDENPERRELIRGITVFRRAGEHYRRSEERHRVRVLDPAEVERALAGAGLRFTASPAYGSFPLLERRLAYVARKP